MGIEYYDWGTYTGTGTTTSGGATWHTTTGTTTAATVYWAGATSASATATVIYIPPPRRIYVQMPEHWTDEDNIAYVHLINAETNTGWVVEALIRGDILITDPSVEKRSAFEFFQLLRRMASSEDRKRIDAFLIEHPLEAKQE